ncbi:MAG: AraC family transcriptional regulator [Christensenella sp.]
MCKENREFNLDITDESCGVIGSDTALARSLPFFIYCAGQIGAKKDYFTKTWYLDGFLLLITTHGQGQLSYLDKTYTLNVGDAVLINCSQFHEYKTLGNSWHTCYIRFDGSAARTYHDYINRDGFCVKEYRDLHSAKKLIDEIINLCIISDDYAPMEISLALTRLLTDLCTHHANSDEQNEITPGVMQAKQFIDEHYAQKIMLEDIARASLLSVYHLSHTFSAQLGCSLHAYLSSVRLTHAKRLLLTTQLTVQGICDKVGFANINVFIRSFKNAVGMTPTAFRSKNFY